MYPDCFLELYKASEAEDVGLSFAEFAQCLLDLSRNELGPAIRWPQALDYCKKLHVKDLALAQACSHGNVQAWERFQQQYRERLYTAALVLARDEIVACELADSISGDLFGCGTGESDNCKSKLASYAGRGSLDSWLKAILTHAYVDRYRSERRVVSLDRHLESLRSLCAGDTTERTSADPRLNGAIKEAFLQCQPENRFLLAAYFFDNRTLADIAMALGVHESTVSRRMNRIIRKLRKDIKCSLRKRGMTMPQIEELFRGDVRTVSLDVRKQLLQEINLARE